MFVEGRSPELVIVGHDETKIKTEINQVFVIILSWVGFEGPMFCYWLQIYIKNTIQKFMEQIQLPKSIYGLHNAHIILEKE